MRERLHNNAHKGTIWRRVHVGAQTPPRKVGGGRCIVLRIVIKLHIMMRERKNRVTPPPPNEMKAKMERTCG